MRVLIALIGVLVLTAPVHAASLRLDWIDNSTNEANFNIERKSEACPGPGTFAEIATTGANIRTFTDATVQEGLTYCYRVAASNPGGKSGFSNVAGATVPFSIPASPSGLTVTPGP